MDLEALAKRLQRFADERDWQQFHSPKNLVMALSVEAAELLEHFQWLTEDQSRQLDPAKKQEVAQEIADIQIYLTRIADQLGISIEEAVESKLAENAKKYPADTVRGSARKYSEYEKE